MSVYSYPQSKIVDSVAFRVSENGARRAYLHAAKDAPKEKIESVIKGLVEEGYIVIPIMFNNNPALEVRGFWRDKSLLDSLTKKGWINGSPHIEEKGDDRKSFKEKFRNHTLQATSAFFMAADLCYAKYGYEESRVEDVLAGVSYFVGSATMGALGTSAQSQAEIRKQVRKLIDYTKQHNVNYDQNITVPIVTENNKRDVLHKIIDTLQTYPAEIGNSFTALAGSLIAYSAMKHRVFGEALHSKHNVSLESAKGLKSAGWKDVGLGTSTLIAGLIGAFIKEKKIDPDAPKAHGVNALWQWVQSKPLRVAAVGYMVSTACHTLSTIQEYGIAKKENNTKMRGAVKWRGGFIACTIVGEILLALSSKGHGHGVKSDVSTEDSVISIAAEIIAQQKPQMRAELIANIGGFLGREDVLGGKDKNMQERLAKQVEAICNNPWAMCTQPSMQIPVQPPTSLREDFKRPPIVTWQSKVAAQETAAQPQLSA